MAPTANTMIISARVERAQEHSSRENVHSCPTQFSLANILVLAGTAMSYRRGSVYPTTAEIVCYRTDRGPEEDLNQKP